MTALEASTFQKRPAYQYLRESDKLPSLAASADDEDPLAVVKLFLGNWTWYISAYDRDSRRAYALVDGDYMEEGEVDMAEIVALRGFAGLPVERDLYWRPKRFSEIREDSGR